MNTEVKELLVKARMNLIREWAEGYNQAIDNAIKKHKIKIDSLENKREKTKYVREMNKHIFVMDSDATTKMLSEIGENHLKFDDNLISLYSDYLDQREELIHWEFNAPDNDQKTVHVAMCRKTMRTLVADIKKYIGLKEWIES